MGFKKGNRVRHPARSEWGLGKVLEDSAGGKARVLFTSAGERTLLLKHVALTLVTGAEANAPVSGKAKRAAPKRRKEYKDIEQLKEKFLSQYPGGFSGEKFIEVERDYKVKACELMNELLNAQSFDQLLAASDYAEVCKRALQVANKSNLIFPNEKMSLKEGLKSPDGQKRFAESLHRLLYGQGTPEEQFNQFADCLLEIGASKWPIATYYLFVAQPESQMFLKPIVTQDAAAVCGFELNYQKEPNWLTYKYLLDFSQDLMAKLADLKPQDMIDVQSFLWCIAQE
ncbi:MAG: DUF3553 domain-containing protein [Acidobacteriota bacterium]